MQQLATKKSYSLEEYFAQETTLVDVKHEYIIQQWLLKYFQSPRAIMISAEN
jgi:hypothetical protein